MTDFFDIYLWGILALWSYGFLGSLHCSVMCGSICQFACRSAPTAQSTPAPCPSKEAKLNPQLAGFLFGRFLTYTIAGFACGLVGSILKNKLAKTHWMEWAGGVSSLLLFAIGSYYVVLACKGKSTSRILNSPQSSMELERKQYQPTVANSLLGTAHDFLRFTFPNKVPFGIGSMTVLLPCGFLWAAFTQSVALANPIAAACGMAGFALATSPALAVSQKILFVLGNFLGRRWKNLVSGLALCCSGFLIFLHTVKPSLARNAAPNLQYETQEPNKTRTPSCH